MQLLDATSRPNECGAWEEAPERAENGLESPSPFLVPVDLAELGHLEQQNKTWRLRAQG